MTRAKQIAIAVPVVVLVAVTAWWIVSPPRVTPPRDGGNPLAPVMEDIALVALRPPSTLFPPGTIIQIAGRDPLVIDVVCTSQAALGSVPLDSSPTSSTELTGRVTRDFTLDVSALNEQVGASTGRTAVRDVRLSLANPVLLQLSADRVIDHARFRTDGCRQAVEQYVAAGGELAMIATTLRADARIDIEYADSAALAGEQQAMVEDLVRSTFGIAQAGGGTVSERGDGLYWGFRENVVWARLAPTGELAGQGDSLALRLDAAADSIRSAQGVAPGAAYAQAALLMIRDTTSAAAPLVRPGAAAIPRQVFLDTAEAARRTTMDRQLRQTTVAIETDLHDDPADASVLAEYGANLSRLGRYDSAAAVLTRAVRLDTTRTASRAPWYNELCVALRRAGREAEASDACRMAVRLDPGAAAVRTRMEAERVDAERARTAVLWRVPVAAPRGGS